MNLQRIRSTLALACLSLALGSTAQAGFVGTLTSTVTSPSAGMYQYDYTLTVSSSSTLNASELFINFNPMATIFGISNTVGWDNLYTPGDSLVDFSSSDPSLDLTPGHSGKFEFFSSTAPGASNFGILSFNPNGTVAPITAGATVAPAPEPSSLVLVAIGGALAVLMNRRRLSTSGDDPAAIA